MQSNTCLLVILSKIPSEASNKKSVLLSILKDKIYGYAVSTPDLPPNYFNLAEASPNDLVRFSPPGIIRKGAIYFWFYLFGLDL